MKTNMYTNNVYLMHDRTGGYSSTYRPSCHATKGFTLVFIVDIFYYIYDLYGAEFSDDREGEI
jgi:hypothetical protein